MQQHYKDYIPESKKETVLNFKYQGRDDSIFYNTVSSPFAQYLTDNFLPFTMAPNMVTLIGFMFVTIPHVLIELLRTRQGVHPALIVFYVLGSLTYYVFDQMDGKQARRTGQSSCLGMVFDHGFDAVNCVL
jgi:ethanolaminephosphotransferase